MKEPVWLSVRAVIPSHQKLIEQYGGSHGIRDDGLLESALDKPKNQFAYGGDDIGIAELAASYAHGLAKNHAFIDGNKRIAFAACDGFLYLNGYDLTANEEDAYIAMIKLASSEWSEEQFATWIGENIKPL